MVADHLHVSFPTSMSLARRTWTISPGSATCMHKQHVFGLSGTQVFLGEFCSASALSIFQVTHMLHTAATVSTLLHLMYVLYFRIHTHIHVHTHHGRSINIQIHEHLADRLFCRYGQLSRGRGWCRAEMWCKLLSEKSDFPIIAPQQKKLFPGLGWKLNSWPCYAPIWSDKNLWD